ncbi:transposase [Aromatoleum petrolei]|uniref:Transposase n=1 Tax=Aromatoleum petrolei TaxID=76116 RepID=A0ABX1MRM6_9RHOO|nr:transposase [Aromatoleum petrolei]NMF88644.1 transposase [Aromatoleum petrolei]
MIADKAFDAANLLGRIRELGARGFIPPRGNRKQVREYEVHQNKVAISFNGSSPEQRRHIATCYDKLAVRFEASISIAAAVICFAGYRQTLVNRFHFLNRHCVTHSCLLNNVLFFEHAHSNMGNQRCQRVSHC